MKMHSMFSKAVLIIGLAFAGIAQAAYPEKPVTIVVPYPAGGATDVVARLLAEKLPNVWGQPVMVVNRPGAGTTVAAESIARAQGDGYTLYMTTAAHTISASLYSKLSYDPIKDFAPIDLVSTIPLVLVTNPALPASTLSELVAYAKSQKNGLSMASTGNGTPQHLAGELFKARSGAQLVHIPYKGDSPMLTDLVGGQVQMAFVTLSAALPFIKSGKLRAIALASDQRAEAIANVPTMTEAGLPGFTAATWFGLFGPASMSSELINKIYSDVSKVVAEPSTTRRLLEMGGVVNNSSPQEFKKVIDAEVKNWGEAVRLSGARVD
ncbi:Bug family tripartite tricarboxylate transporter substrate binding protein [Sheuella amnicola]|nr:tripartite tricarboxylate transporter substrate binding protein [Sheuella amnicola]